MTDGKDPTDGKEPSEAIPTETIEEPSTEHREGKIFIFTKDLTMTLIHVIILALKRYNAKAF